MTLAHSYKRSSALGLSGELERPAPPRSTTPIDLRDLVRRPASPVPQPSAGRPNPLAGVLQHAISPARPAPATEDRPKSDVALDILSELSVALPTLMERNRALEAELVLQREQADAELNAVNNRADALQAIAETLKAQLARMEAELAAASERASAAEQEVQRLSGSTEDAHRAAAQAECLASLFEDKVMDAFGAGTVGHALLEELRAR